MPEGGSEDILPEGQVEREQAEMVEELEVPVETIVDTRVVEVEELEDTLVLVELVELVEALDFKPEMEEEVPAVALLLIVVRMVGEFELWDKVPQVLPHDKMALAVDTDMEAEGEQIMPRMQKTEVAELVELFGQEPQDSFLLRMHELNILDSCQTYSLGNF